MTATAIEVRHDGPVVIITLSRPASGNALDVAACEAFQEACRIIERNAKETRAVLLRGQGKNFCVGGDLAFMSDNIDQLSQGLEQLVAPLHDGIAALARTGLPIVAAVRGAAAGAGFGLAALADIIICTPDTKFVMAYSAIGLTPDGGSTWSISRAIGQRRTLELLLTNRKLTAAEARDWGLVSEIVDDDALDSRAMELATILSKGPTKAFQASRSLIERADEASLEQQLDEEMRSILEIGATTDAREGVIAFFRRSSASFRGL